MGVEEKQKLCFASRARRERVLVHVGRGRWLWSRRPHSQGHCLFFSRKNKRKYAAGRDNWVETISCFKREKCQTKQTDWDFNGFPTMDPLVCRVRVCLTMGKRGMLIAGQCGVQQPPARASDPGEEGQPPITSGLQASGHFCNTRSKNNQQRRPMSNVRHRPHLFDFFPLCAGDRTCTLKLPRCNLEMPPSPLDNRHVAQVPPSHLHLPSSLLFMPSSTGLPMHYTTNILRYLPRCVWPPHDGPQGGKKHHPSPFRCT